jgi:hypothetical protein
VAAGAPKACLHLIRNAQPARAAHHLQRKHCNVK